MEQGKHELLRQGLATHSLAIVVAAGIIAYSLPDPRRTPVFEGFVADGKIVRLDTRTGNVIACDFSRCVRVLGNGKALEPNSAPGLTSLAPSGRQALDEPSPQEALGLLIQSAMRSIAG